MVGSSRSQARASRIMFRGASVPRRECEYPAPRTPAASALLRPARRARARTLLGPASSGYTQWLTPCRRARRGVLGDVGAPTIERHWFDQEHCAVRREMLSGVTGDPN